MIYHVYSSTDFVPGYTMNISCCAQLNTVGTVVQLLIAKLIGEDHVMSTWCCH